MHDETRSLEDIEVIGGHPAVDFVNTVASWNSNAPGEYLNNFEDFLRWSGRNGLLWTSAIERFRKRPQTEQQAAFKEVRKMRESLHAVLAARAAANKLPQEALDYLNAIIRRTVEWRRIAADADSGLRQICCVWDMKEAPAIAALGPVAWKAAELLELGELSRLKECPGDDCGWLFLDTSKNRSRQWCSMKTCGNTAKVKRFRNKKE